MAGINPYLEAVQVPLPKQSYSLTVLCEGETHELTINPRDIPFDRSGQPGSILDICLGHDIHLEHTCGGVIACSTCHVIVKEGLDSCNPSTDDEEDQLDKAPGLTMKSRLGCQCVPNGTKSVVIEVPEWNRNAVKETPH
jgi:ferredoxin, 2Fe-2S